MSIIRILIFALIFTSVAFFLQSIIQPEANEKFMQILSNQVFPHLPFYSFIKNDIAEGTLTGVAAFTIFANIPFLPNPPVEPYVIFAFTKGTNPVFIVLTVSAITVFTSTINYFIGFIFGPKIIEKITKKEFKYSKVMNFLSAPITFLTHLLPIPILSSALPFVFGAYKANYKNFAIAAFFGVLVRFILVIYLFDKYGNIILQLPKLIISLF